MSSSVNIPTKDGRSIKKITLEDSESFILEDISSQDVAGFQTQGVSLGDLSVFVSIIPEPTENDRYELKNVACLNIFADGVILQEDIATYSTMKLVNNSSNTISIYIKLQ